MVSSRMRDVLTFVIWFALVMVISWALDTQQVHPAAHLWGVALTVLAAWGMYVLVRAVVMRILGAQSSSR
ncbi:hypothetical protein GCM10011584_09800 [Nocardioides phosphati]|uniref:Uncharacterized protein n=1 Tax=Nocardioides phosphati TaxID=1867775 RepID=A0ABQ2N8Y4_9ACTN|nr:hypothetical protein [Nocardioides phosphati]GGO86771.1 hypothetical protein GCM10011584_09800 [Nocardioides phosphati]